MRTPQKSITAIISNDQEFAQIFTSIFIPTKKGKKKTHANYNTYRIITVFQNLATVTGVIIVICFLNFFLHCS